MECTLLWQLLLIYMQLMVMVLAPQARSMSMCLQYSSIPHGNPSMHLLTAVSETNHYYSVILWRKIKLAVPHFHTRLSA
jgi:hypothetical protein